MSTVWENYEPSPIEYFHGELMDLFHEFRKTKTDKFTVEINGNELNDIIAKAKKKTYAKYEKLNLRNAILKTDLQ